MTTTGKRQRYATSDSDNDNNEPLPLKSQRSASVTGDFASHRLIVSERQQLAVLKQLTASDDLSSSSSLIIPQQRPTKIHRRNEHGETILHISARKGNLKQLKKALKGGANVNEADNAGWTPLHEAVTKNQFPAASLLLKSGANANAPGPEGQTPLIDAVLNNNTKMVGLLLHYSADPSVIDLTRVNETMVKVLKKEMITFNLSDNENNDECSSPSSPISSGDDFEHEEKSHSLIRQRKSFSHFSSLINPITNEINGTKPNPYGFESGGDDTNDMKKENSISDDEYTCRVPPLKIVLARTSFQKSGDSESTNSFNMDENSTMENISLPIIEQNEKFLSTIITSIELNDKVMTLDEEQEKIEEKQEENILLTADKNSSPLLNINYDEIQSPQMIISTLIDNLITQIDDNMTSLSNSAEEEDINKKKKQNDLKPITRTLRSHARGQSNFLTANQTLNNNRRISNRRRALQKNICLDNNEKLQRKKPISERETSSNSDDQTTENLHSTINEDINITTDDGSNSNNSTMNIKPVHSHPDLISLPPNKRRLRERNVGILNSTESSTTINSCPTEENSPIETTTTRDMPINGIKQFLEIRQQIDKRHEAMLHDFVLPKVPKEFAETLMAKKDYLIAPLCKTYSSRTPTSIYIKRLNPPSDLDTHLSDIFSRQEDERYRMKLRHQVEREKLILSHEQEILRLYGNETRLLINQDIPFSYCSLLKDNEVYNNSSIQERASSFITNDYTNTELNKRAKLSFNDRSITKWLEDSNLKYKRLSCEINQRQYLESNTLYSMQRMVWLKHLPKENSSIGRLNIFLSERYLPKVEINTNFWTPWQTSTV